MAVIQISKIQVRRGLQENLPQLAGGEFGWSVDEGRLFIGNGTLTEGAPEPGNTEILTIRSKRLPALSYDFKGTESGYTSQTGPTVGVPVNRSLQEKLDDIVNFRDFITEDDHNSGNYTQALQRAIDEVFKSTFFQDVNSGVRRILKIPAGKWNVSNVVLPPYATIQGDGKNSTFINGSITQPFIEIPYTGGINVRAPVIQVRDNQGNIGNLASATSRPPSNITIQGLSIISETSASPLALDNANKVNFIDVGFVGAQTNPAAANVAAPFQWAVAIGSSVFPSYHIFFERCTFQNAQNGLEIRGDVNHVTVDNCIFDNLKEGVKGYTISSTDTAPQIKVTNSYFSNIANTAIRSLFRTSIISAFNKFDIVGYGNGAVMNSGTVEHPIFAWDSCTNYSLADTFERTAIEEETQPIYLVVNPGDSLTTTHSASGTLRTAPGYSADLSNGETYETFSFVTAQYPAIIDYQIYRNDISGNLQSQIGTIRATFSNGNVYFENDYTETGNVNCDVRWGIYGSKAVLTFEALFQPSGYGAYISYSTRTFF